MRKLTARFFASFILVMLTVSASSAAVQVKSETFPLERSGCKLHLERLSTVSGDHKPLLMVHGLTYSSHEFNVDYRDYSLAKFFARRGYDVWLLDIAGYGQSQEVEDGFLPDSDYAAEDIAAAAKAILERSGAKQLDVLGWSWGTVTSGRFAAKYPDMVRRLVLYAPIVAGLADVEVTAPFNHNTWVHAAGDFQTNPDGSINSAIAEPEVVSTFQSNCWRYDKDSSPNGGRRDLLVSPEKRLIPTDKLTMPVLIIAGEKDQYVTPELCREAFGTLTNRKSRIEIISGAAHAMMMEKPYYKQFRARVLSFLRAR
ncbi:MAG: alpha/beta hydrolase [Synergistaceae bacterium]|nr:alpha/beta hydrolase [Synergistaceae bacterium]